MNAAARFEMSVLPPVHFDRIEHARSLRRGWPRQGPLGLSPSFAVICRSLLERDRSSRTHLLHALQKAGCGATNICTVNVRVWRLQKRLGPIGVHIQREYGRGWYLDHDNKRRLRAALEGRAA